MPCWGSLWHYFRGVGLGGWLGNVPSWTPRQKSFPAWASAPSLPANAPLWAQGLCMCLIPFCCSDRPWSPGSCQMAEAFPPAQDGAPETSSPPCLLPRMAWNRGLADQRWESAGRQAGRMEVSAPSRGCEVRLLGSYPQQASTVLDTQRATEMCQVAVDLMGWVFLIPGSPKGKNACHTCFLCSVSGPTQPRDTQSMLSYLCGRSPRMGGCSERWASSHLFTVCRQSGTSVNRMGRPRSGEGDAVY